MRRLCERNGQCMYIARYRRFRSQSCSGVQAIRLHSFPAWPGTAGVSQTRILVVGVGFKRGQSALSISPGAAMICSLLSEYDTYVEFADPLGQAEQLNYVPKMDTERDWNRTYLSSFAGIIVAVDQIGLDLDVLEESVGVQVQDFSRHLKRSDKICAPKTVVSDFYSLKC
jgi:hypothetical protein